jgi:hypothetical protein
MKLKVVVVDLEMSRRQKRIAIATVGVAVAAAASVALATPKKTFSAGEVLKAADLNTVMVDMDARVAALEALPAPEIGPAGPAGVDGEQGPKGDPGAFPATFFTVGGNNGTVSCDTFCSNIAEQWGTWSGTCVSARIGIGANPSPIAAENGEYIPCSQAPTAMFGSGWNAQTDGVACACLSF